MPASPSTGRAATRRRNTEASAGSSATTTRAHASQRCPPRRYASGSSWRAHCASASVDRATGTGRTVALAPARSYRLVPWRADGVRIVEATSGRTRTRLVAPVRLSAGRRPIILHGRAENGVVAGRYRGTVALARVGGGVLAVNHVGLERYLYGVVPEEMFASWPRAALRAQAVAARSYALTTRRPDEPFDVFADTRSQVYGGIARETERTTAAVRDTRRLAVLYRDAPIQALFHASSGGRTAAVEEVFASPPLPYPRSTIHTTDSLRSTTGRSR